MSAEVPPRAPALGKHEELARTGSEGCTCAPTHLRLRSEHGELVQPRGKSVNRCDYCAKLAAVENCEMLVLDALEGNAPRLLMILGTRTATLDMGRFRQARQQLAAAIRRRWPDAEYAYQVEFTTGYGPRSGGLRRPHWNWFWKGIPDADVDEARVIAVREWCRLVDAVAEVQYVALIDNAVGLTKYVTEHFMKASQRPPAGFTGQRFNCSRGYFGEATVAQARARAKASLAFKRELHKLGQVIEDAHDLELAAHLAVKRNAQTRWVLTTASGARLSPTVLGAELHERLAAAAADEERTGWTGGPESLPGRPDPHAAPADRRPERMRVPAGAAEAKPGGPAGLTRPPADAGRRTTRPPARALRGPADDHPRGAGAPARFPPSLPS